MSKNKLTPCGSTEKFRKAVEQFTKGKSLPEAGLELGVQGSFLSMVRSGTKRPSLANSEKFCKVIPGITLWDIHPEGSWARVHGARARANK